jgi:hypothetical protein
LPQGKRLRTASVGVLLPLIAGSESKRFATGLAPRPIVMLWPFHSGASDEGREAASILTMACA